MVKPGPRSGQMVCKIQHWLISSQNRVYHLYKSVPFTKKRTQKPEPSIKDDFEEMEHGFPFGIFLPEKQDYLFRCSVAPRNFPMERPKSLVRFTFQPDFPENFGKWSITQVTWEFSAVYLKSSDCNSHKTLEAFLWEKQVLPPSHACMVFHTNPCKFQNFQNCHEIFPEALWGSNLLLIHNRQVEP